MFKMQDLKDSLSNEGSRMKSNEVLYSPSSLRNMCLDIIGRTPSTSVMHCDLTGFGEPLLSSMLHSIISHSNLTVPIVRHFEEISKIEGHENILKFVSKMDILTALR